MQATPELGVSRRPTLSVVIPTHERRELLLATLRALTHQTMAPDRYEVVVSIDASVDGTADAVKDFAAPYPLYSVWPEKRGRAAACNAGILKARGKIVVLLDDDMSPSSTLLEAHLRAHSAGNNRGVLGPIPVDVEAGSGAVVRYVAAKFDRHLSRLAAGKAIGFRDLYTSNFSIRRSVLLAVGLFDEEFTQYGNEDGELGIRLLNAGVQFDYVPEAIAHHRYTKRFADVARDSIGEGHTAVRLAQKHPEALSELRLGASSSRRLRAIRGLLLRATDLWPVTPRVVVAGFEALGSFVPPLAEYSYPVALDYFFWIGARAELRASTDRRQAS